MNIVIMGTGAMGSFFGGYLARAGHNVLFIARGRQLQALLEQGPTVRSLDGGPFTIRVDATDAPETTASSDLILMFVKIYDTTAAFIFLMILFVYPVLWS